MAVRKMESTGWALWWIWLWTAVTTVLLILLFFLPFKTWAVLAVVLFGLPELIGIVKRDDAYPPLTHVICRYVPRWIAFTLIYAFTGAAGGHWFGFARPVALAGLVGLLGWFQTHFDVAFDAQKRQEERDKYQRIRRGIRSVLSGSERKEMQA